MMVGTQIQHEQVLGGWLQKICSPPHLVHLRFPSYTKIEGVKELMRQCKNGGRGMCEGAEGRSTLRLHHGHQEEQGKLGQFSNLIRS